MKRMLMVLSLSAILLFACGCGHNQGALISGKAFIVGGQGIQYYNGLILLDNSRENSSWKVEVNDEDGATADSGSEAKAKGIKSIERKVDKQVTGYLVDLSKQDPEAVEEYLRQVEKKQEEQEELQQEKAEEAK